MSEEQCELELRLLHAPPVITIRARQVRLDVRGFSPTLNQQGSHQRVARHTDILELPASCEAKNRRCQAPVNAHLHWRR
jgi:hypothetical protein